MAPRFCFCCVAVGDGLGAPHAHAVSTRRCRKHGPHAGVLERGSHEAFRMDTTRINFEAAAGPRVQSAGVKKVRVFLKMSSAIELSRTCPSSVGVDIFPGRDSAHCARGASRRAG